MSQKEKLKFKNGPQKLKVNCFLDFEFNCGNEYDRVHREIISIGAVFCDEYGNVRISFHRIICPTKYMKISDRCIQLTGIDRRVILKSPTFDVIVKEFLNIIKRFECINYYVWGEEDKRQVLKAATLSKADKRIKHIADRFIDLQEVISNNLKLRVNYSLENTALIYNIKYRHNFCAIDDAMCLKKVFYKYNKGVQANSELIKLVNGYYHSKKKIGNYKTIINSANQARNNIDKYIKEMEANREDAVIYNKLKEKLILSKKSALKFEKQIIDKSSDYAECIESVDRFSNLICRSS